MNKTVDDRIAAAAAAGREGLPARREGGDEFFRFWFVI